MLVVIPCIVLKFKGGHSVGAQSIYRSLWAASECVANSRKVALLVKTAHLKANVARPQV